MGNGDADRGCRFQWWLHQSRGSFKIQRVLSRRADPPRAWYAKKNFFFSLPLFFDPSCPRARILFPWRKFYSKIRRASRSTSITSHFANFQIFLIVFIIINYFFFFCINDSKKFKKDEDCPYVERNIYIYIFVCKSIAFISFQTQSLKYYTNVRRYKRKKKKKGVRAILAIFLELASIITIVIAISWSFELMCHHIEEKFQCHR